MRTLIRPLVTFALVLCVVSQPAMAAKGAAATYVETLGNAALATISNQSLSKEKKQATLEALFKDNVDFPWVARFVMGRYWKQATDEQKARYVAAYTNFLTKNYTSRFTEYTSGSFRVTDEKSAGAGESLVGMEIVSDDKSEPPVLIDYKVRKAGGGYKVFDIIVEGVSLLTTQRSEFSSVLNKSGIDGLIGQLESKK